MRSENTTGSPPTQHPMVTDASDFHAVMIAGNRFHLFQVNAGLPAEEAINSGYSLLDAAEFLASDAIANEASHGHLVAIRMLLEAGKALVGSVMGAVEEASQ